MEKQYTSKEILESINGIQKSVPNAILFSKIKAKLDRKQKLATQKNYFIAASILLLLTINIIVVSVNSNKNTNFSKVITPTLLKNNQLYE
jgi:hypothetical protein